MNKPYTVTRELAAEWSDNAGDYEYKLYTFLSLDSGERRLDRTNTGTYDWAKRIALHYGIKMPELKWLV